MLTREQLHDAVTHYMRANLNRQVSGTEIACAVYQTDAPTGWQKLQATRAAGVIGPRLGLRFVRRGNVPTWLHPLVAAQRFNTVMQTLGLPA